MILYIICNLIFLIVLLSVNNKALRQRFVEQTKGTRIEPTLENFLFYKFYYNFHDLFNKNKKVIKITKILDEKDYLDEESDVLNYVLLFLFFVLFLIPFYLLWNTVNFIKNLFNKKIEL